MDSSIMSPTTSHPALSTPAARPQFNPRPLPWRYEPDLHIPELENVGLARIPMAEFGRHTLVLGETGSGKTISIVQPILRAVLRYPGNAALNPEVADGLSPSMLIMDPKHELADDAIRTNRREQLRRRIIRLDTNSRFVLHWFEGTPIGALGLDEQLTQTLRLSPGYEVELTKTNSAFFVLQASLALQSLLDVDRTVVRLHGIATLERFWASLSAKIEAAVGSVPVDLRYARVAYLRPHTTLITLVAMHRQSVLQAYAATCDEFGVALATVLPLSTWLVMRDETVAAIVATALNVLRDLSGALAERISLNPFEPPPARNYLSIRQALDEGLVLTMSPNELDPIDVSVAVAAKTLFFRHAFTRSQKQRPVAYIADEAHMVLTVDAAAEYRFLDRCRAFRCAVVLATQSVASLRMRLNTLLPPERAESALDILLANSATKFWFRSTDPGTRMVLRSLIPSPSLDNKAHVVDICPPSVLRTGECYWITPQGWGRGQIELPAKR